MVKEQGSRGDMLYVQYLVCKTMCSLSWARLSRTLFHTFHICTPAHISSVKIHCTNRWEMTTFNKIGQTALHLNLPYVGENYFQNKEHTTMRSRKRRKDKVVRDKAKIQKCLPIANTDGVCAFHFSLTAFCANQRNFAHNLIHYGETLCAHSHYSRIACPHFLASTIFISFSPSSTLY